MDKRCFKEGSQSLLRQGILLEYATMCWNVVAVGLLIFEAIRTRSIAILGFGFDSFIEIGASIVVVWQLRKANDNRQRQSLRIISILFAGLVAYIGIASISSLVRHRHPDSSMLGIAWLFLTLFVMLALAAGKESVGKKMGNPVLRTEARVTLVDAYLAGFVLLGLLSTRYMGWWWADSIASLGIVLYGIRESRHAWKESKASAI
jgi:divalent metal cation (Fe/Co/Zn/Cd) transporter